MLRNSVIVVIPVEKHGQPDQGIEAVYNVEMIVGKCALAARGEPVRALKQQSVHVLKDLDV